MTDSRPSISTFASTPPSPSVIASPIKLILSKEMEISHRLGNIEERLLKIMYILFGVHNAGLNEPKNDEPNGFAETMLYTQSINENLINRITNCVEFLEEKV